MPANKIRGETPLKINDTEYTLRPTFQAIIELETMTGRSAIEIIGRFGTGRFAFADIVPAFVAFANAGGASLSYDECGEMVLSAGINSVAAPIAECLIGALMPEDKKPTAKEKN